MTSALPSISPHLSRLLWLYDALTNYPHSNTALFENTTPGAAEALRIWAGSLNLPVTERASEVGGAHVVLGTTADNYAHISVFVPSGETK